jgi:hypothetical protein
MPKPILIAGHPGDLIQILAAAAKSLADFRALDRIAPVPVGERVAKLDAIAKTTLEALEMWLGRRPIPLDDGE